MPRGASGKAGFSSESGIFRMAKARPFNYSISAPLGLRSFALFAFYLLSRSADAGLCRGIIKKSEEYRDGVRVQGMGLCKYCRFVRDAVVFAARLRCVD